MCKLFGDISDRCFCVHIPSDWLGQICPINRNIHHIHISLFRPRPGDKIARAKDLLAYFAPKARGEWPEILHKMCATWTWKGENICTPGGVLDDSAKQKHLEVSHKVQKICTQFSYKNQAFCNGMSIHQFFVDTQAFVVFFFLCRRSAGSPRPRTVL